MEHTNRIPGEPYVPNRQERWNIMKRLILVVCALAIVLAPAIAFPVTAEAAAKPAIKSLDANSLIGMATKTLTAKYGKPARVEPSEYGFSWYVYNRDYKNFFMAGVKGGKVVAVYTNAKTLNYKNQFKLNATRATVRAKLGKPISYIRSGNTVSILSNAKQRDFFDVKGNFVVVFYDTIKGGKVTSILIVPKDVETKAIATHPALSSSVLAAYARITVDLVNATRARNGLRTLKSNALISKLALSRSKDMRDRNYFDHYTPAPNRVSPFTQAKRMGIKYKSMGENISYGDHNAIFAHEAFMNSSGHRKNILKSAYRKIGTGAVYGGSRYVLLSVEFTN
jgi:uncharacterized protein YkwD